MNKILTYFFSLSVIFITISFNCKAQPINHLTMSMENCSMVAPDTIQFDLYVVSDGDSASDIRANAFQYGVNFDTCILQTGASKTVSFINGSSDFTPLLNGFAFP